MATQNIQPQQGQVAVNLGSVYAQLAGNSAGPLAPPPGFGGYNQGMLPNSSGNQSAPKPKGRRNGQLAPILLTCASVKQNSTVMLKTATASISHGDVSMDCGILFDDGAMASFVTRDLANALKLVKIGERMMRLSVFGSEKTQRMSIDVVVLNIHCKVNNSIISIYACVVPTISKPFYYEPVDMSKYPSICNLEYARDLSYRGEFEINILIGSDFYYRFVGRNYIETSIDGPVAHPSLVGYLLSGPLALDYDSDYFNNFLLLSMMKVLVDAKPIQKCVALCDDPDNVQSIITERIAMG